jgi:hypothetical protein
VDACVGTLGLNFIVSPVQVPTQTVNIGYALKKNADTSNTSIYSVNGRGILHSVDFYADYAHGMVTCAVENKLLIT